MAEHTIRVVMQSMADSDGLSDSASMRRLLKMEARKRATEQVSANQVLRESAEAAQVLYRAA